MREIGRIRVVTKSVLITMADRYGMEANNFERTLRATVVPAKCSQEQFAAFLLVANQYNLNPITREIYAFPRPDGGIQPIVGVDGWAKLMNDHPAMDGMTFNDIMNGTELIAIECSIFRKDRSKPTSCIEYLRECRRDTMPWKQWPARMLRHKSMIQTARYAFGFSGIVDPDEFDRIRDSQMGHRDRIERVTSHKDMTPTPPPPPPVEEPTAPPEVLESKLGLKEALRKSLEEVEEAEVEENPAYYDPDKLLSDLERDLVAAKDPKTVGEVWDDYKDYVECSLKPDQEKASKLLELHQDRVTRAFYENRDTDAKKRKRAPAGEQL
jgi:phage recombination protein Bet